MIFEAEDWGPYESLFNNMPDYNVEMTWKERNRVRTRDVAIRGAGRDVVTVQLWRNTDDDEPTGLTKDIRFEDIERIVVY